MARSLFSAYGLCDFGLIHCPSLSLAFLLCGVGLITGCVPSGSWREMKSLVQGLWLLIEEALDQVAGMAARPSSTIAGSVALRTSLNLSELPLAHLKICLPGS